MCCKGPKLLKENINSNLISEGLKHCIKEGIPIHDNIYRPQSKGFISLISESRKLYNEGIISLSEEDKYYFDNSDLGTFGLYEGKKVPLDYPLTLEYMYDLLEAKSNKKTPQLNKPKRGGAKKFYVYVRDPKTKRIKKVSFGGTTGLNAKINNPEARRAFAKRHKCSQAKDKTKARYWSCRLPSFASLLGLKSNFSGYW